MKNDENNDLKRLKKTAEDALPDSLKRNEPKSSIHTLTQKQKIKPTRSHATSTSNKSICPAEPKTAPPPAIEKKTK